MEIFRDIFGEIVGAKYIITFWVGRSFRTRVSLWVHSYQAELWPGIKYGIQNKKL